MSIAYMILDFRKTQTILEIKESTEKFKLQESPGREPLNQDRPRDISGPKLLDTTGRETLPAPEVLDTSGPKVFGQVRPR